MTDPLRLLSKEPFTKLQRRFLKALAEKKITPGEFVVLAVVADRTVSWRRLWEELSYTDLEEASGLSRRHVGRAVQRLLSLNLLARKELGQGFAYAIVPSGWTTSQLLAACDVDNAEEVGTSGPYHQGHHVPTSGAPSSIHEIKEGLRRPSGHVDKGLGSRAHTTCPDCGGDGWVVHVEPDGFTESVSRCVCVE